MIDGWYRVFPVDNGWGVFEPGGEYLYMVFNTKEEAEKWAEQKNKEIEQ